MIECPICLAEGSFEMLGTGQCKILCVLVGVVGILTGALTTSASGQTLASTNPNFAKYYSMTLDGGPTYTFGPSTPYNNWSIFVNANADFLGLGTPQILLGGFGLLGKTWLCWGVSNVDTGRASDPDIPRAALRS
jgi:hypothetical protein